MVSEVGDMRMLKFENIDFDKGILNLSNLKCSVTLPISENLLEMLKEQKQDYDFQEYVFSPSTLRGSYKPYSLHRLSM